VIDSLERDKNSLLTQNSRMEKQIQEKTILIEALKAAGRMNENTNINHSLINESVLEKSPLSINGDSPPQNEHYRVQMQRDMDDLRLINFE
jgi:hypothetical protein